MRKFFLSLCLLLCGLATGAVHEPEFSTAGFFRLPDSGREVFSMNPAWRFHKGAAPGAEKADFDDRQWAVVSLPHGIDYLPTEASGCINYQGEVWYRKHFTPEASLRGKKVFVHFEAIMGKSKVYLNGKLLAEHYGGYLPVVADLTDGIDWNSDNVLAVWADNSNDPTYPPGTIKVTASVLFPGTQMPVSGSLVLHSVPAAHPLVFAPTEAARIPHTTGRSLAPTLMPVADHKAEQQQRDDANRRLKEVEQQQTDFGEKR